MLVYVLGRCPDEFGLVPSTDGFVPVKTLLQALAEEQGWKHVRRGHLNELLTLGPHAPVEIVADGIRAVERSRLPSPIACPDPPKLLYTAVRRRAYAHVLERGIEATAPPGLILAAERPMAVRIGGRRDPDPLLLEVRTRELIAAGATLWSFGERLFVASALPAGCFSGPVLPKAAPAPAAPAQTTVRSPAHPGSFFLNPEPSGPSKTKKGQRKEPEWKRQRRLDRRQQSHHPERQ